MTSSSSGTLAKGCGKLIANREGTDWERAMAGLDPAFAPALAGIKPRAAKLRWETASRGVPLAVTMNGKVSPQDRQRLAGRIASPDEPPAHEFVEHDWRGAPPSAKLSPWLPGLSK